MSKEDEQIIQEDVPDYSIEEETTEENSDDEIAKLQDKILELEDKYIRTHADFENTKKRLEKEKALAVAYSNESFAKDMLNVMDSFDGAMASIGVTAQDEPSEVIQKIHEGVEKIHDQLKKMLEKNGIKEIDCSSSFDPTVHQAIMQVEDESKESGVIVQVLQKGYTIKEQVLRPAMVSTAK